VDHNDGSYICLRPARPNHMWPYDFVADRCHDRKAFRVFCIIDEFSRESIAIRIARMLKSDRCADGSVHTTGPWADIRLNQWIGSSVVGRSLQRDVMSS
jgi:hypothetical protein